MSMNMIKKVIYSIQNNEAILDKELVFYVNDGTIDLEIVLNKIDYSADKYKINILTPDNEVIESFPELVCMDADKNLYLPYEFNANNLPGKYKMQITLMKEFNYLNLPEFEFEIKENITGLDGTETIINTKTIIGECVVRDGGTSRESGYISEQWYSGDVITTDKMNNMVNGINEGIESAEIAVNSAQSANTNAAAANGKATEALTKADSANTNAAAAVNGLSGKANIGHTHTKTDITDFPTKLSEFQNDIGAGGGGGSGTDGHTHANINALNSITDFKIAQWDDKPTRYEHTELYNYAHEIEDMALNNNTLIEQTNSQLADITNKITEFEQGKFNETWYEQLTNATSYPTLNTYEGSGQTIHPSVLYFPNGWNGYKYWMGITPFPSSNDFHENPSIFCANDLNNWVVPNGLTNPLDSTPDVSQYYLSDANLVYRADLNRLECWYRKYEKIPAPHEIIYRRTSTDGVNWTAKEQLYDEDTSIELVSPSAIYENGKYKIWVNSNNGLTYYESIDGKAWTNKKTNLIERTHMGHTCITKIGNYGYACVSHNRTNQINDDTETLYYSFSVDGINNWSEPIKILNRGTTDIAWDRQQVYRPCLLVRDNDFILFYSGRNTLNQWHTGYSTVFNAIGTGISTISADKVIETSDKMFISNSQLNSILDRLTALENGVPTTPVQSVSLPSTLSITKGSTATLTATINPTDATNKNVTWSVNNSNCTIVGTGLTVTINAIVTGSSVITVTTQSGSKVATCNVTIDDISGGDNIVTNGLTGLYDASNYGTDATKWKDLSGNNNDGTKAVNSGSNGGFIDGAYITNGNFMMFNPKVVNSSATVSLIYSYTAYGGNLGGSTSKGFYLGYNSSTKKIIVWRAGAEAIFNVNNSITEMSLNTKAYVDITHDKDTKEMIVYVNGVMKHSGTCENIDTIENMFAVGGTASNNTDGGTPVNAKFYGVKFYNRVLSQAEITKNYNYESTK